MTDAGPRRALAPRAPSLRLRRLARRLTWCSTVKRQGFPAASLRQRRAGLSAREDVPRATCLPIVSAALVILQPDSPQEHVDRAMDSPAGKGGMRRHGRALGLRCGPSDHRCFSKTRVVRPHDAGMLHSWGLTRAVSKRQKGDSGRHQRPRRAPAPPEPGAAGDPLLAAMSLFAARGACAPCASGRDSAGTRSTRHPQARPVRGRSTRAMAQTQVKVATDLSASTAKQALAHLQNISGSGSSESGGRCAEAGRAPRLLRVAMVGITIALSAGRAGGGVPADFATKSRGFYLGPLAPRGRRLPRPRARPSVRVPYCERVRVGSATARPGPGPSREGGGLAVPVRAPLAPGQGSVAITPR